MKLKYTSLSLMTIYFCKKNYDYVSDIAEICTVLKICPRVLCRHDIRMHRFLPTVNI